MMFEMSFSLKEESDLIRKAVNISLEKGIVTEDISSIRKPYKTSEVGDFLVNQILISN